MKKDPSRTHGRHGFIMEIPQTPIQPTVDVLNVETADRTFDCLSLPPPILSALKSIGFVRPSPVQLRAIPLGRLGADLIVQAKSGTGKTCVFCVVALETSLACASSLVTEDGSIPSPVALALTPTREIAVQVSDVMSALGSEIPEVLIHSFIGGLSVRENIDILMGKGKFSKKGQGGCHIAVGTPGRVLHLIEENIMGVSNVKIFILDEADKLMAANFCKEVMAIADTLPARKQVLALSATYPRKVLRRVKSLMFSPKMIQVGTDRSNPGLQSNGPNDRGPGSQDPDEKSEGGWQKGNLDLPSLVGVSQYYFEINERENPLGSHAAHNTFSKKIEKLFEVLSEVKFLQCVVFCNHRTHADSLAETLDQGGWPSISLSGQQNQEERLKNIKGFRNYQYRVLVTTDISARGIDVSNVNLVINMEIPYDPETYTHRVGRTGRFGTRGTSITFINSSERSAIEALQDMYSMTISPLPNCNALVTPFGKGQNQVLSPSFLRPPKEVSKTDKGFETPGVQKRNGPVGSRIGGSNDKDCGAKPQKYCNAKTLEFLKLENDLYDTWILKASLVEVQAMKCEWDHSKKDL